MQYYLEACNNASPPIDKCYCCAGTRVSMQREASLPAGLTADTQSDGMQSVVYHSQKVLLLELQHL